jgi:hypothetical protein
MGFLWFLDSFQKHIMLRNGRFEFDNVKQGTCCCGHSVNDRLDCVDCCIAKSKEICICDGFKDKEYRVVAQTQKQGKLPKKEEQKQKEQIEDNQFENYIQTLAKM